MSYSDLLKDPRWQKLRLNAMEAAGWKCSTCGREDKTFNVHHRAYKKGAMPWEYDVDDLDVLCEECHKLVHMIKRYLSWEAINGKACDLVSLMINGVNGGVMPMEEIDHLAKGLEWWLESNGNGAK
jgi:hypothetical protein